MNEIERPRRQRLEQETKRLYQERPKQKKQETLEQKWLE
jgi:hypothetical protein